MDNLRYLSEPEELVRTFLNFPVLLTFEISLLGLFSGEASKGDGDFNLLERSVLFFHDFPSSSIASS